MKTYRFDCNGHNAPAYSCNEPGDNSGLYCKAELVEQLVSQAVELMTKEQIKKWIGVRNPMYTADPSTGYTKDGDKAGLYDFVEAITRGGDG